MSSRLHRRLGAVVGVALAVNLALQPWRALRDLIDTDFLSFLAGSRLLATHAPCIYCAGPQHDAMSALSGVAIPGEQINAYRNPPLTAWLLQPLLHLDTTTALGVFLAVSMVAAVAGLALLALRVLPETMTLLDRTVITLITVASLPAAWTLALGQWDGLILAAIAGGLVLLRGGRPFLAGLAMSIIWIKPQLGWLVPPALLAGRHWRALWGMVAGGLVVAASTVLLLGDHLGDWFAFAIAGANAAGESTHTIGLPGLTGALTGSPTVAVATAALAAIAVLAVLWRSRNALRADPLLAVAAGLAGSLVAAPHVWSDDLLIGGVALAVWARHRPGAALAAGLGLSVAYLADLSLPPGPPRLETLVLLAAAVLLGRDALAAARGVPAARVASA